MDKPAQPHQQEKEITIEQTQIYEGPLPHPDLLQGYEDVYAGAAKEIFDLAKKNQAHIIWMDREGVKLTKFQLRSAFIFGLLGQIGTTLIAVSGLVLAYLSPSLAKEGFAFSAIIAGYLVWWKTHQKKDN